MSNLDIDKAYECFKKLVANKPSPLYEADSRAKLIDPIFKDCLVWDENIAREEHVNKGFIDYRFQLGNTTIVVLDAKETGDHFIIPEALNKRRYKINGAISTDN